MKKILAIVIAVALLAVALAGCFGGGDDNVDDGTLRLTYWSPMPSAIVASYRTMGEMTMFQELERITGVRIQFFHPPIGGEWEQFNLMIASRDLMDMMESNWFGYPGGPDRAIADGVIHNLSDLIPIYAPNYYNAIMSNDLWRRQVSTDLGNIYGFASLNIGPYRTFGGLIIRGDWLDSLELDVPETIEEWETALTAFRDEKGATAPLTFESHTFFHNNHFNNAFDVGLTLYVDEGVVRLPALEPGFRDYVELMRRWYAEGLLDTEVATNNSTLVDARITTGASGATHGWIGGTMGRLDAAMRERDPNFRMVAAQFPVLNRGNEPRFIEVQPEANHPFVAITTNLENPADAMRWMDFFYSEEGMILKNFGVEGVTFNMVDGRFVYTDEILRNPRGLSVGEAMTHHFRATHPSPGFNQHPEYLYQFYQLQEQVDALILLSRFTPNGQRTMLPPLTPTLDESDEINSLNVSINTFISEMVLRFINGREPMDRWDNFVDELVRMGANRFIELNQNALNRYLAR